jgi:hypothetical protein
MFTQKDEHYILTLHFEPPEEKLPRFRIFPFGLGGPSINMPNFSFLPDQELGYLLWTHTHTYIH